MSFAPFLAPERDERAKQGRAKASGTTYYTIPGLAHASTADTFLMVAGTDYYMPVYVETPIVVDQLVCHVTSALAGNARIGLYRADTDWQPVDAPLADSGDIDTSTTGYKTYTPSTPLYLPRGRYLSIINASSASSMGGPVGFVTGVTPLSTTTSQSVAGVWRVTRAYAAFPTPGTAWTTVTATTLPKNLVFFRISVP